jgi:hypothetical protein
VRCRTMAGRVLTKLDVSNRVQVALLVNDALVN